MGTLTARNWYKSEIWENIKNTCPKYSPAPKKVGLIGKLFGSRFSLYPQTDSKQELLEELQYKLIFCIMVAGKPPEQILNKLPLFYERKKSCETPFEYIKRLESTNTLLSVLKNSKIGNYTKHLTCLPLAACLNVYNCTVKDLESIPFIGLKTSRLFMIHGRNSVRNVILGENEIKYLKEKYPEDTIPDIETFRKKDSHVYNTLENMYFDKLYAEHL